MFQYAPYFHPSHWEPEDTDHSAELTREAGIQGHRRHAAGGNSWKSNSPFWVIALSRQQASLLAPIHKFTITLSSLWLSTLHHRVWLLSSLKNQGNFLLFSAFFHLIETAILIPMYLPHKLAQQALPIENLWPAFLLSVDTEPLSCYGQKHLHSLSVYQFYTPLPTSMWHGS